MCSLLLQSVWDVLLTFVGVFLGFIVAVRHERNRAKKEFEDIRKEVLKQLLHSLKENEKYLEQITDLHFSSGEFPTFPLDTVCLAYVAMNARRYLPSGTNWGERYNKLRFELDHINRKTEILIHFTSILLPTGESHRLYDGKEGVLNRSICQFASSEFEKLKTLIDFTKKILRQEIETLEKFV